LAVNGTDPLFQFSVTLFIQSSTFHSNFSSSMTKHSDGSTDESTLQRLSEFMALANQGASVDISQLIGAAAAAPENNKEKARIAQRLGTFNAKDNAVWKEICARFGNNIKQPELRSIANVLASHANLKLDRDATRRKSVLIKWFDEHWAQIEPYLDYVVLEDAHV
jgi:hypothetical protein